MGGLGGRRDSCRTRQSGSRAACRGPSAQQIPAAKTASPMTPGLEAGALGALGPLPTGPASALSGTCIIPKSPRGQRKNKIRDPREKPICRMEPLWPGYSVSHFGAVPLDVMAVPLWPKAGMESQDRAKIVPPAGSSRGGTFQPCKVKAVFGCS